MNNKMKKVNIEIEIPVDCEIEDYQGKAGNNVAIYHILYKKRKPKELVFREVIGAERIPDSHYYMKEGCPLIYMNNSGYTYPKDSNETIYELVQNEC